MSRWPAIARSWPCHRTRSSFSRSLCWALSRRLIRCCRRRWGSCESHRSNKLTDRVFLLRFWLVSSRDAHLQSLANFSSSPSPWFPLRSAALCNPHSASPTKLCNYSSGRRNGSGSDNRRAAESPLGSRRVWSFRLAAALWSSSTVCRSRHPLARNSTLG